MTSACALPAGRLPRAHIRQHPLTLLLATLPEAGFQAERQVCHRAGTVTPGPTTHNAPWPHPAAGRGRECPAGRPAGRTAPWPAPLRIGGPATSTEGTTPPPLVFRHTFHRPQPCQPCAFPWRPPMLRLLRGGIPGTPGPCPAQTGSPRQRPGLWPLRWLACLPQTCAAAGLPKRYASRGPTRLACKAGSLWALCAMHAHQGGAGGRVGGAKGGGQGARELGQGGGGAARRCHLSGGGTSLCAPKWISPVVEPPTMRGSMPHSTSNLRGSTRRTRGSAEPASNGLHVSQPVPSLGLQLGLSSCRRSACCAQRPGHAQRPPACL